MKLPRLTTINMPWKTDSKLHKFMEINWVPCDVIFDKEGKLADFNAERPFPSVEEEETPLEEPLQKLAMK